SGSVVTVTGPVYPEGPGRGSARIAQFGHEGETTCERRDGDGGHTHAGLLPPPTFSRHIPRPMPDVHQPYVPASQSPAELTPRALILGVLLGLIFSASSVYLALKIGLTVSSSIPIAVLSITIFRALGRTSILENNIVQTTGSASDSVA